MEANTQIWSIGQLQFTVDIAGPPAGALVLLLHGFPQTRRMWRHQLDALAAAGFRAIAPDQRGYSAGARPNGVESYASNLLLDDALALIDSCGGGRFHLIGHDWGGQLAWLLAARNPERVATLTVLSRPHPGAFTRAMTEDPEQANRSRHHSAFRRDDAAARLRQDDFKLLRDVMVREGIAPESIGTYLRTLAEPHALEAAINWYRANNIAALNVRHVSVPTLYVWGTADASVGRRAAELTREFVTGPYEFVEIEGGGHFIVDQFPARIASLVLAHLRTAI